MNGIDIASYQAGINLAVIPCDFVIIKATEGISYINPDYKRAMEQALSLKKLVGVYHYVTGSGVETEARHFLETAATVVGKAVLFLDWEETGNSQFHNPNYVKAMLDYIAEKTGVTPGIYMSKSVCRQYGWPQTAAKYPLWVAQYQNYSVHTYKDDPWTDHFGYGAWNEPIIFQYSSVGRFPGFGANVDLNQCYLDADEWRALAAGQNRTEKPTEESDGLWAAIAGLCHTQKEAEEFQQKLLGVGMNTVVHKIQVLQ